MAYAGPEDVALAVDAAPGAFADGWSDLAPSERAKYLFRIARILQERSREFAVLESLDGGKPIASRATSTCRSPPRTSSTTPAGRTSSVRIPEPGAAPARGRRPVILELPAPDALVEGGAGPRRREHRRAQAGRNDAADGAPL